MGKELVLIGVVGIGALVLLSKKASAASALPGTGGDPSANFQSGKRYFAKGLWSVPITGPTFDDREIGAYLSRAFSKWSGAPEATSGNVTADPRSIIVIGNFSGPLPAGPMQWQQVYELAPPALATSPFTLAPGGTYEIEAQTLIPLPTSTLQSGMTQLLKDSGLQVQSSHPGPVAGNVQTFVFVVKNTNALPFVLQNDLSMSTFTRATIVPS